MKAGGEVTRVRHELRRPAFLALVSEVCEELGRPEDGLAAVADALADSERTGQRYWDAELVRLRVQFTPKARRADTEVSPSGGKGDVMAEAEASFLEAIEIARRQRARSSELRAATSLSRLWADQKKVCEARALLSETYDWFTEGFDTPDLCGGESPARGTRRAIDAIPDEPDKISPGSARGGSLMSRRSR